MAVAVLAAQADALQARLASPEIFQRLNLCTELLAGLAVRLAPGSECAAAAARLDQTLDDLAFFHAQQLDLARQTADMMARALRMLAGTGSDSSFRLPLHTLAALYISEEQHRLHQAVVAEWQGAA